MQTLRKLCLAAAPLAALVLVVGLSAGRTAWWQPAAVAVCVALALGLGAVPTLRGYQFTAWIIAAVTAAMIYPQQFLSVGPIDLRNPWLILIVVQAVMFGMGTQMSLRDFAGVLRMPWGVLAGVACQFTIMPLVGFSLTKLFHFPDEIAAGIILIGSCSSGLASNVMCYLAGANLPLSITLTAVATLLAPLLTPFWMKQLAGTLVEIDFFKMMIDIIEIVLVPIGAALLHDYLKRASPRGRRIVLGTATAAAAWIALLLIIATGFFHTTTPTAPTEPARLAVRLSAIVCGAVIVGVVYHWLARLLPRLDHMMPLVSMAGIIYFTAVTTAAGRDDLLLVGGLLFLAAVIHNALGYVLGYWLSRAMGLDRTSARTVALEVGLQNGGMASGLAGKMGKLATLGLAAAIFSPWMNISGSLLANYWRRRPEGNTDPPPQEN